MKHLSIFSAMVLGIALSVQPVQAEDLPVTESENVDSAVVEGLAPEGAVEEDLPLLEEGEEGEVTERGVRRFKMKPRKRISIQKKPPSRITIPQKTDPRTAIPRPKQPEVPVPPGNSVKPPAGEVTPPTEPPAHNDSPPQCVWKTSDIIDQRIDISAQERLMHMMGRGGEERIDASAMIGAVKQGALAGILLAPRKAVSDRGQRMTPPKGWWDLIPQGQLGTCLLEPIGEPPMMLYRDKNGETNIDPSVIDHTLRTIWGQCGLPTPDPACSYLVDLHKPPPESDSPDQSSEGYGELQVFVAAGGRSLQGARVSVRAILKESPGHQNYQSEYEPEKQLMLVHFTNGEGIAAFLIPPVQNRISVQVTNPGFYTHTSEFGFLPKDTKGISVELEPIPLSGTGS